MIRFLPITRKRFDVPQILAAPGARRPHARDRRRRDRDGFARVTRSRAARLVGPKGLVKERLAALREAG
ncbi:hypothetical protein, partial [Amycolatopsis sp. NPDC006125]|uniref:hypothetical protein n=1 Tax=Amycolatopsis sp. NPDC006125 TaxID=3156730 RepID=UPI0033BA3E0E